MATKLDRTFVADTLNNVRALALEVERLETYCGELEDRLLQLDPKKISEASQSATMKLSAMPPIKLE